MELKKNDVVDAEIVDYTTEGSGICKIDGMAVFVPSAAVGDRANVRILKVMKNHAYGKIEELITPSPQRICSNCSISEKCGGCSLRHISYGSELAFKQKRVTDALTRIGGINGSVVGNIVGADDPDHYRNKAQLPVTRDNDGRIRLGFFAPRSHRIIPLDECMLQTKCFQAASAAFLEWANKYDVPPYDEKQHSGILRHLYLRYGAASRELMVCIVANASSLRHEKQLVETLVKRLPELKTVVLNINTRKTNVITGAECRTLYGDGYIIDELRGLKFRISPLSFYQVNHDQAERLYSIASEFAGMKENETLLDLYCGTGTIGLSMASGVRRLIGVEIIPQAVHDARTNAAFNKIYNAEFICADASEAAAQLSRRDLKPDCIVIDPPRKGCDSELIKTISEMNPGRIVYVSCDPATLARDIKAFSSYGYSVLKAVPVDMFPRTTHVETVVLMSHNI